MRQLLEVQGISVSFDGFKAINNLSFSIGDIDLRAIIGPNGAGKTTFMDIVTGKTRPDQGEVLWGNKNISLLKKTEAEIAELGIGRKFQKPTVFQNQTVKDNFLMALKKNRSALATIMYKLTLDDMDRIMEIAKTVNLSAHLPRLSGELSHGQKQWLEIGMLLLQDPKLLLIDEPAAGMTLKERDDTASLLRTLSSQRAVVVVEHDMKFIRNLDCRVTVLHEGGVLAEGNIDYVSNNKDVIDVYLGR
tara:strand:+ start:84 stop:824 length:741 start_codon:yes stop_codon:yes gene_type:complete